MEAAADAFALVSLFFSDVPFYLACGLLFGVLIGVLPGMGPLLGVILAIPFTFYLGPISSIALLIGIYQGGNFGGAVTAAMIGIPGTPMATATLLDAYPMARAGKGSQAITIALVSSVFGTVFGGVILLLLAPLLARVAMSFGPAETAALALLGLSAIASLSEGSTLKGLLAGLFGLILATVGSDPMTSFQRFSFGSSDLSGGVTLVAMMMGLFAVSELLIQLETPASKTAAGAQVGFRLRSAKETIASLRLLVQSSSVGVVIGAIPGVGSVTSAYLSYKFARDGAKDASRFGKGDQRGVIASEAANSATTGGALIPLLAIGIPGDPVTAAMMGGLLIQGLTPGPMLFANNVAVVQGVFATFLLGGLLLLPIGLALMPLFGRILRLPSRFLLAGVLVLCIVGTYLVQQSIFDLWLLWLFGALGYAFRKLQVPLAPMVIGFILGPILEVNLRRASMLTGGDPLGFLVERHLTIAILALTVVLMFLPALSRLMNRNYVKWARRFR